MAPREKEEALEHLLYQVMQQPMKKSRSTADCTEQPPEESRCRKESR